MDGNFAFCDDIFRALVAPLAGAWIEIFKSTKTTKEADVAPLAGAWIEIDLAGRSGSGFKVAPLAGAWIEM